MKESEINLMNKSMEPKPEKRPDGRYLCQYGNQFFYGETEEEDLRARKEYIKIKAYSEAMPRLLEGDGIQEEEIRLIVAFRKLDPTLKDSVLKLVENSAL